MEEITRRHQAQDERRWTHYGTPYVDPDPTLVNPLAPEQTEPAPADLQWQYPPPEPTIPDPAPEPVPWETVRRLQRDRRRNNTGAGRVNAPRIQMRTTLYPVTGSDGLTDFSSADLRIELFAVDQEGDIPTRVAGINERVDAQMLEEHPGELLERALKAFVDTAKDMIEKGTLLGVDPRALKYFS